MGKQWKQWQTLSFGAPKSLQMVTAAMKLKDACPWKKSYDQCRLHIKKQRHYVANKVPSTQSYGFSSSHVWMWESDHKEGWVPKNWYIWIMVLEKTQSPLDSKEIKPVNPKGYQPWIFLWRTAAEAETPILWPPNVKRWLTGKTLMLGKTEGKRGRGWQRMIWLDSITDSMDMCLSKLFKRQWKTKEPGLLQSMGLQRIRHDSATEQQQEAESPGIMLHVKIMW